MRGAGTTTIYNSEYHTPFDFIPAHQAASSSAAPPISSSGMSSTGEFQVVVPHVTVLLSGGVQLKEGATVDVIRFLRAGKVAKIKLPNGKTGFVLTKTIVKE